MNNHDNHRDEFEQFIADEVNRHEMFASDAVWAKINKQVQTPKSWPALTIIAFLIIVSLSIATALNYPPDNILAKIQYNDSVIFAQQKQQQAIIKAASKNDNLEKRIAVEVITAKTFSDIEKRNKASVPVTTTSSLPEIVAKKSVDPSIIVRQQTTQKNLLQQLVVINIAKAAPEVIIADDIVLKKFVADSAETKTESDKETERATDNKYKDFYASLLRKKLKPRINRWSYEIYATPSQSFRNLSDDKIRDAYTASQTTNSLDNAVKHKPALGLEAGFAIMYNLTNHLKFKAGIQFNARQYYIDAYKTYGIATVTIIQNNRIDSLSFYSRYGSVGSSYAETKLDNRLYQVSIPLGFQWDALQTKRFGVSIGGTIQPTFTLNKNVYLISTDYKYYANGESFFRKWNINTAVDINFSYQFNKAKLYIGPQVRYQHLPTYTDAYPIKEYRLDYGIKIGIIKPL